MPKETPEQRSHRLSHSDWERAHELLDQHGVMNAQPGQIGTHLIERLEAVLKVWDAIGELSARSCHDLRFMCNTPEEAVKAIQSHREAHRAT